MEKDDEGWRPITWAEGLHILQEALKEIDERLTVLETLVHNFHMEWQYTEPEQRTEE